MNQQQTYKRRNRLPQPRFQLKLVASFAGMCVLALLGQVLVVGAQLTETSSMMSSGGVQLADAVPGIMTRSLLASAVLVLPALVLIGIRLTFRFAGPLYRIEQHLRSVAAGERPGHCRIRKTDDLQELCQLVNEALDSARSQGEADAAKNTSQDSKRMAA